MTFFDTCIAIALVVLENRKVPCSTSVWQRQRTLAGPCADAMHYSEAAFLHPDLRSSGVFLHGWTLHPMVKQSHAAPLVRQCQTGTAMHLLP